jgi:hypothetical protein
MFPGKFRARNDGKNNQCRKQGTEERLRRKRPEDPSRFLREIRTTPHKRRLTNRLFKRPVQQGRSKRRGEAYFGPYVKPLSAART